MKDAKLSWKGYTGRLEGERSVGEEGNKERLSDFK
jgi:hypothetical protein